jgi:glycosyltransferase involved in cell wall biosynthesis
MREPDLFAPLSQETNVHVQGPVSRAEALSMAVAADVCLIPHRETPMSRAMSPLKLYEYLGAGRPVVATDLPPMREVSDRCILVPAGTSMADAIRTAAQLPPLTDRGLRAFRDAHSWDQRYAIWRHAALGV